MDEPPRRSSQAGPEVPVSIFHSPIDQLLRGGALTGASRPGVIGTAGRFEVLRVIGTGGMGVVVMARDPQREGKVAIKFLRAELSSNASTVTRFRAEAEHMQRLKHPGVVPVLEIAEKAGGLCFVMPFFEAGSLAQALHGGQALGPGRVLRIASDIAGALVHSHSKGIIHRDLKPANVLLDSDGSACLSDFGLSRTVFNDVFVDVDQSHCEGTAPYMSPAVANGEAEDTRCDIYGFGAVLYEMLTGRPPYQGQNTQEILAKIKAGAPTPIRQVNPKADASLTAVSEGAMARELRHRYAQMRDALKDLKRIEAGLTPLGAKGHRRLMAVRDAAMNVPWMARWLTAGMLVLAVGGAILWRIGGHHLEVTSTLSPPQVASWANAQVVQWDGVGSKELVIPRERDFVVVGSQGQLIGSFGLLPHEATPLRSSLVADVNGDGLEEAFAGWADETNAHLAAINQTGFPLRRWKIKRTENVRERWGRDITMLWGKRLEDLDADGKLDLLASVNTDHSQPRGLYCFDLETEGAKWVHTLAGLASSIEVADLDGDGTPELAVGTHAPSNGVAHSDGTDDQHSYLLTLSARGDLRWRREIADYFTSVQPVVFNSPATRPRLYAWTTAAWDLRQKNRHPHPDLGRVVAFSGQGDEIGRYDAGYSLFSCVAAPASWEGRHRILATDRAGRLHGLTPDLTPTAVRTLVPKRFDAVFLRIVGTLESVSHPNPYLVLESAEYQRLGDPVAGATPEDFERNQWHNRSVIVLDQELREIARFTEPGPWSTARWQVTTADLDSDGVTEILWLDERLRILRLRRGR